MRVGPGGIDGGARSSLDLQAPRLGCLPGEQQTLACQSKMDFTLFKCPEENETKTVWGRHSPRYVPLALYKERVPTPAPCAVLEIKCSGPHSGADTQRT